ncbi:MAG: MarR family transcriptional regulator [Candidatus Nanopelagicales bacterium]|nr:MarR family transcriptional regulator [Candidatus Nanopelagicales bacterium]
MVQATKGSARALNESLESRGLLAMFKILRASHVLSPHDNIDIGAIKLVSALSELGPSRLGEVAREAHLDISTASRHAAALERQRLVGRSPDPDDGRACVLELTAEGADLLRAMLENRAAAITPALREWSAADKESLFNLLIRLSHDMNEQVELKRRSLA